MLLKLTEIWCVLWSPPQYMEAIDVVTLVSIWVCCKWPTAGGGGCKWFFKWGKYGLQQPPIPSFSNVHLLAGWKAQFQLFFFASQFWSSWVLGYYCKAQDVDRFSLDFWSSLILGYLRHLASVHPHWPGFSTQCMSAVEWDSQLLLYQVLPTAVILFPLSLCEPCETSLPSRPTHQHHILWMILILQLCIKTKWVSVRFHVGNPFCKNQVIQYIGRLVGK